MPNKSWQTVPRQSTKIRRNNSPFRWTSVQKMSVHVQEFCALTHTFISSHTHIYRTYMKIKVQYVIKKEGNPFGGYLTGLCSNARTIHQRINVKFVHFFPPQPVLSTIRFFFTYFFLYLFFVKGYDKKRGNPSFLYIRVRHYPAEKCNL